MKRILLPALMSATLIAPVFATTATTQAPAPAADTTSGASKQSMTTESTKKHSHHGKMTPAEMKADCEKMMGDLNGSNLTGDEKILFDTKMAIMKSLADSMDKFSDTKSGKRASHKLHTECSKMGHHAKKMLERAEKKAEKEKMKMEGSEKKADAGMKKEEKKDDKKK